MKINRPVVGIVLDGFGIRADKEFNAILAANMPNYRALLDTYPHTQIFAAEEYVGLPKGQMGNSEVGHINLGAGRRVLQDLMRINYAIKDGSFAKNKTLKEVFSRVKAANSTLHLLGLVSDGGVHSSLEHLLTLIKLADKAGIKNLKIHCFTDGRDTRPDSGSHFVQRVQILLNELGIGRIATVCGRFFAMDREDRWARTEAAFNLIALAEGRRVNGWEEAFAIEYKRGVSDEFIPPYVVGGYTGLGENDELLFFNFRPDRMRQLSNAFAYKMFAPFKRKKLPKITCTAMTMYDHKQSNIKTLFPETVPKSTLSETLSRLGMKQLKIAETTKYAHVTYYFNGGVEAPYKNEKRVLIESENVENFADYPVMKAAEIAGGLEQEIGKKTFDFVLVNFANGDMVGHTGNFDAAVKALEALDAALGRVVTAAQANGYTCVITADHGNIEDMRPKEGFKTTHTLNPVPFIVTDAQYKLRRGKFGLECFAPTVLDIMELYKPKEMTGESIIKHEKSENSEA